MVTVNGNPARPNSWSDLVHPRIPPEILARYREVMAHSLLANQPGLPSISSRSQSWGQLLDPRRDIDAECGYPPITDAISVELYRQLFDREPIPARVCELMPKESWQMTPTVYEDEDASNATEFEEAWDNLGENLAAGSSYFQDEAGSTIWEYLQRADTLSGIGHFGIILLGLDDGKNLQDPVDGILSPTNNRKVVPLRNAEGVVIGGYSVRSRRASPPLPDCEPTENEQKVLKEMVKEKTLVVNTATPGQDTE